MAKTGAQILVDMLIKKGVEYVFGIPGGAVLPLFDTLYQSVREGLETQRVLESCSSPDYREKLEKELS